MAFLDTPVLIGQRINTKSPAYVLGSLRDIFDKIKYEALPGVDKLDRYFFSQSLTDIRPTNATPYDSWSGITVVDLDVHNAEAAKLVKTALHRILRKQAWFAAIALSTSGRGCHIYTVADPANTSQTSYLDHLEAVSIHIWNALMLAYQQTLQQGQTDPAVLADMHPVQNVSSRTELANGELSDSKMFDLATFKLTQPTLLGYDPDILINDFCEVEAPLGISEHAYDACIEPAFLRTMFDKKRGRTSASALPPVVVNSADLPCIDLCVPRNYNNTARYRLAYTLAAIYDITSRNHANYQHIQACFLKMCSGNPKFEHERLAFAAVFDSACARQAQGMSPVIPWAVHELQTIHQCNIATESPVVEQLTTIDIDAELAKPIQMPPELCITYDKVCELSSDQYITHAEDTIMSQCIRPGGKVLLIAEPGTGKTVFITNMMKKYQNKRILCVVPYISVVESKFKTLDQYASCQCIYGNASFDPAGQRNAVMTFDKFSKMLPAEIDAYFDLVCLDESHLLQMSLYRGLVPANAIDNLRAIKTPAIVMTGTPIAEHMFINFTYKVLCKRDRPTSKLFNLVVCNNPAERFAQACLHISNAIRIGRRVIVPTNEGNAYVEKIVASVQTLLGRPIDYAYYKKENADKSFMFDVNQHGTIRDIELLFCSAYLSVGVDINDMAKFDIVYTEAFTAHEIEQFNNRLRKVDLASYYFVAKFMADNRTIQRSLLSTAKVNLRMSRIRELALSDLVALNKVTTDKSELTTLFDFVTNHMDYPYLIRRADGDVELHPTCYALYTFEETWRAWAVHVPILMQQLKQYNYQTNVMHTELLDNECITAILESARAGFAMYNHLIKNDIQYLTDLLSNKDFFDIIVYSNRARLAYDNLHSASFASFNQYNAQETELVIYVQNVAQCHRFIKCIRKLSKYYVRSTILKILADVDNRTSVVEHIYNTVELLDYAYNDRLSDANATALTYIVKEMFAGTNTAQISRKQMRIHKARIVDIYRNMYRLCSNDILNRVRDLADSMIRRLCLQCTRRRGDDTPNDWQLRQIPAFDSSIMRHLNVHKQFMFMMFKASLFATNTNDTTHDEATKFFVAGSAAIIEDRVDILAALNHLHEEINDMPLAKKHFSQSMFDCLVMQAMVEIKAFDKEAATEFVKSCDFDTNKSITKQLHEACNAWLFRSFRPLKT